MFDEPRMKILNQMKKKEFEKENYTKGTNIPSAAKVSLHISKIRHSGFAAKERYKFRKDGHTLSQKSSTWLKIWRKNQNWPYLKFFFLTKKKKDMPGFEPTAICLVGLHCGVDLRQ